jgi:hypothetical protein
VTARARLRSSPAGAPRSRRGTVETLIIGWQGAGQAALLGAFVVVPAAVLIGIGIAALRPRTG